MILVPPHGPSPCDVLFTGEAPGRDEAFHKDPRGRLSPRPFVGKAGREQDWYLSFDHLSSKSFRLANVIPEFTPGNPDPTEEQIKRYTPDLIREVHSCNPKIIVAVGRFSMWWFLGSSASLDACHGLPHRPGEFDPSLSNRAPSNSIIIPIHHPAGGFYKPKAKGMIAWDYGQVSQYIDRMRSGQNLSLSIPRDEFEGKDQYLDVTGKELEDLILRDRLYIQDCNKIAIDTEGTPSDPWSIQFCWKAGHACCLRYSQPDFLRGIQAIDNLIKSHNLTVLTHCSSTPQGTMYDIIMCRAMGWDISRFNIRDTMYNLYLLRNEYKGLKPSSWRFGPRMKMTDYMSLTMEYVKPYQLEYLSQILSLKSRWTVPEKSLVKDPDGTYRLYKEQPIYKNVLNIIKSIDSGKLDKDGNPPDPQEKWNNISKWKRIEVERILGSFPYPSLEYVKDKNLAIQYACADACATFRIDQPILDRIAELDLHDSQFKSSSISFPSIPLAQTSINGNSILPLWESMQSHGIPGSREKFQSLISYCDEKCDIFRHEISTNYFNSQPINPNSPDDTGKLIQSLKIPVRGKRTKTGKISTAKDAIEYLRYENPAIEKLFLYREHDHIKSSFAETFLETFSPDQSIHFVQSIIDPSHTETRRPSSRDPNLLNVPSKTELGRMVRDCFIAPPGYILGSVDYSGIELRVMASESKDKRLCSIFNSPDPDPHRDFACTLLGRKDITKDERYFGKTMNFSVGYGMHHRTVWEKLQKEGQKQWSPADAQHAQESWWKQFSGVREYRDRLIIDSRIKGYVRDRGGMNRFLPSLRSRDEAERSEAERMCFSHRIQGTAQTALQNAMIKLKGVFEEFHDNGIESYLILQVYDELLFLSKIEYAEITKEIIQSTLIKYCGIKFNVPIATDGILADSWGKL